MPEPVADGARLGGWQATVEAGALAVRGEGSDADWWRVVATAGWTFLDATGTAADATALKPPVTSVQAGRR